MITLTEARVEAAALAWLAGLGWQVAYGPDIAGAADSEWDSFYDVVLPRRLWDALLPKLVSGEVRVGENGI